MEMDNLIADIRGRMKIMRNRGVAPAVRYGYWAAMHEVLGMIVRKPDRRKSCPDCYADLPGDGSCCDACGWTRKE